MEFRPLGADYTIPVPNRFGNYEFKRQLGDGASSVVILAENVKTHVNVACKILLRKKMVEEGQLARIEQELRIIERLKYPGIVGIEKVVYLEEIIIVVMEYCPNGTLYDYVVNHKSLPNWEVKKITRRLLETLNFLHSKGIAHRDIKLDNIVLNEDFEPKLIDFGLCTELSYKNNLRTTFCGTLEYIAPEIICEKRYCPFSSDIWALGVCVYTMATGEFPWFGSVSHITNSILRGDYQLPSKIHPSTRKLIQAMMKPNPIERVKADELIKLIDEMDHVPTPMTNSGITKPYHKLMIIRPSRASMLNKQLSCPFRINSPIHV